MSARLESMRAGRVRAQAVSGLRGLARAGAVSAPAGVTVVDVMAQVDAAPEEHCDLCRRTVAAEHRHMLDLEQRCIVCTCEACWALRSGEEQFAPVGHRTLWLEDFDMPDDIWASFGIPIGLAFFLYSSVTDCVVALYPSPAGATESELRFDTWMRLRERNRILNELEPDGEALIVNRMGEEHVYAIAPIDRAYELVGLIKTRWEGISGGTGLEEAVASYFDGLRAAAGAPA
ncbi:MAG: hypothetical protein QOG59_1384 [Solirubrobacteraceae bacterium]|nr:hypothetical protein [Solirubrobacteraceae bacterium]